MKQVCGSLKLELAQFREVAAFAQFGSDLDASTQSLLKRGARLTEVLKQPQYQPLSVSEQVVVIYAATRGFLDNIEMNEITNYETELLASIRGNQVAFLEEIASKGKLSDDMMNSLKTLCTKFTEDFIASRA